MLRRSSLVAAIAAVAACAAPSPASATELKEGATLVPVGSEVIAKSSDTELKTWAGTFACGSFELRTKLEKNSGGTVQLGPFLWSASKCVLSGEKFTPITTRFNLSPLKSSEPGKGTVSLSAHYDFSAFDCEWTGTVPFVFAAGSDTIFVSGGSFTASPALLCEKGSPASFSAHLALTTNNGTPLSLF